MPATSIATMPPVLPSQGGAVSVPVSVADEYCGTRITWKRFCPWTQFAAPCRYVLASGAASGNRSRALTGPAATTYS